MIKAPVIIIYTDIFDKGEPILEIDFGEIKVKSDLVQYEKEINYKNVFDAKLLYDKYTVEM